MRAMKTSSSSRPQASALASMAAAARGKTTLADHVTSVLAQQIRSGEFAPDARLPSEMELTERFSVSRTVIREAISRLKSEGLVGSRRGSGTVVLPVTQATPFRLDLNMDDGRDSIQAVLRVIELRRGVEGEMAALAAQRRTRAQNLAIQQALQAIDAAAAAGRDGVQEDFAFHAAISNASHNPLYTSLVQFLSQFLHAAIRVSRMNEARSNEFVQQVRAEHAALAQAINDGNAEAARAAALRHMEQSALRLQAADKAFWASAEGQAAARDLARVREGG
ncbi:MULTISPECIES: FadR/GntR family transcriptional regulator [Herbaspirillum]|jgi:GntR family transcriptional repressor for pyruvate dehydrogenase complex|uniref:FadR/GntR family transcriptional regulator n=1 Tax=Herbaspirillum TaxID=963 RepID=UPI001AC61990|nr:MULTISPECIES: FadR/GntR family transcriptional regulator [Herbaspirillum]MBN9358321.1 FadR family transcriptional regulator [Herbaspirillum huttiense]MCP3656518.1 FadR family transcriptional regulator [Herbaspirillum sp.]MCP3949423.1 FadR family transcriptional regulator [Herbaspirillum sp.]MCP4030430.1 FadR family transcriptional regulator [Herbaspirillum sp.]MCP4556835.1 FadR family transcriptional regulator [Herbaspirillum sp.]